MVDIRAFALQMLQHNPAIARNPQAQSMLQVIQTGDEQQGEQIARNLCQTMGISPEEATKQAKSFFRIPY